MPDGTDTAGRIGPNAVLQLAPVLDHEIGTEARRGLFDRAGFDPLPDAHQMIDETRVAALHQALRRLYPETAASLARAAGTGTGDYILAHRIPHAAQILLRTLPASLSARLLLRAILAHGWTFCGTGRLSARAGTPIVFELEGNPIVSNETSRSPICDWHAGVFTRLFSRLVHPESVATETACCAMGAKACRFEIRWKR